MMTNKEYQQQLVRMWDSIRSRSDCKGTSGCSSVDCNFCPFNGKVCNLATNTIFNAYKSIEIVENWAEQHPVKTNADKFREVFGMEKLPFYSCIYTNADCRDCEHFIGMGCKANGDFWNAEYKGKTEGCEEE